MERSAFFYRILLPSLMAIALFMASLYVYVIPSYRESLLDKKRETIRELTNTAWSVMQRLDEQATNQESQQQAMEEARQIIKGMRYGEELKDYFWISDTLPAMIMHPYRPQLDFTNLSEFEDPEGKRFFVEIANIAANTGDGFIDYKWQWKDDSLMVVPKLSYVKLYEPWGWIVGTGIYVEDVQREIAMITRQVVYISVLITIIISAIISYLARRNFLAEKQRQKAQRHQKETTERYKKLVESSSDGVLMTLEGEIIYCNPYLMSLMGFDPTATDEKDEKLISGLNCFFQIRNEHKDSLSGKSNGEIIKENKLKAKDGTITNVVTTRSHFEMGTKKGFIYTVKDVSQHKDVERELDLSLEKFKSIADMMNLGVFRCTLGRQPRFVQINNKGLKMLGYKSLQELQEMEVQDLFHERSERKEIVRAISESVAVKDRLLRIRKADGATFPTLVSLFPVKDSHDKSVYCDGILTDAWEQVNRSTREERSPEQLSASILLKPVKDFIKPVPRCDINTPINVASRLMTIHPADIILITTEKDQNVGLITHRDISRRVVAKGKELNRPVAEIMSSPVVSVLEQDMVVDAFTLMIEHRISYVVIQNKENLPIGYISLLSLSELRKNTPEYFISAIQKAGSADEVAILMKQLPRLIETLVETGTGSATAGKLISRISDTVTEKFIKEVIALRGEPPVPYVFLALGSEGRKEQSLATDQDNAIIFVAETDEEQKRAGDYFLSFGKQVCTLLDKAGYPFCVGEVMAMNPQWCLSLKEIREKTAGWINTPNPEELLKIGIFFDFRPVYGDFSIATQLSDHCREQAREKNIFIYNLAKSTIAIRPSAAMTKLSQSGGKEHIDHIDIKEPLMAITAIMRFWALKFGVREKNTLERLETLQSLKLIPQPFAEEFSQSFTYLTHLRIRNQLHQSSNGQPAGNRIPVVRLSEFDRMMLKKIHTAITNHHSRITTEFRLV